MDTGFKTVMFAIVIVMVLIILKFTVCASLFQSDTLIPGVTDSDMFTRIDSNSTLGQYILSDNFMNEVSGVDIESRSEMYATNETTGEHLFNNCCNSLLGIGMEKSYTHKYTREYRYTGIYKNETTKIVFHIFEGSNVEEYIGFNVLLTVYKTRISK